MYEKLTEWSSPNQVEYLKAKHKCYDSYSDEMRLCQLCKKLVNEEPLELPSKNLAYWWYDVCDKDYSEIAKMYRFDANPQKGFFFHNQELVI